jgi:hypothetical protein
MMNNCKLAGEDAGGRRNAPKIPPNRKISQALSLRPFDSVAYFAVLEVLG